MIWPASWTPPPIPGAQPFLLDLMRRFELCFSFPDEEGHYLLPDLLDKQEPVASGKISNRPPV